MPCLCGLMHRNDALQEHVRFVRLRRPVATRFYLVAECGTCVRIWHLSFARVAGRVLSRIFAGWQTKRAAMVRQVSNWRTLLRKCVLTSPDPRNILAAQREGPATVLRGSAVGEATWPGKTC